MFLGLFLGRWGRGAAIGWRRDDLKRNVHVFVAILNNESVFRLWVGWGVVAEYGAEWGEKWEFETLCCMGGRGLDLGKWLVCRVLLRGVGSFCVRGGGCYCF